MKQTILPGVRLQPTKKEMRQEVRARLAGYEIRQRARVARRLLKKRARFHFELFGSLPAGVYFDPATGLISGAPKERGRFRFTVTVTDRRGGTPQPIGSYRLDLD